MVEQMLFVSSLTPNRFNPNVMQPEEYQALKTDMERVGPSKIDPVTVSLFCDFYPCEDNEENRKKFAKIYVIVDGEHRYTAAKELGWREIRCDVQVLDEEEAKGICYRKNKDRGTIDPFKEAALFKSEMELMSQKEIAEKYLVDPSTVSHRLSLLKLVPEVHEQITKLPRGTVTTSHLEPIASLPEEEQKKFEIKYPWSSERRPKTVEEITNEAKRIKENLEKHRQLKEAVEKSSFKVCPKCGGEPTLTWKGLPWVDCKSGNSSHEWNLETGKGAYQQETYSNTSLDGKKSAPIKSSVLRCAHTVKELSQTFESRIKDTLPKLKKIEHVQVRGELEDGRQINLEFSPGSAAMHISLSMDNKQLWFRAEDKKYRSGEKSKVDTPSPEHVERIQDFIDLAFAGKLEVPESKRLKGKIPESASTSPAAAESSGVELFCVICDSMVDIVKSVHHEGKDYCQACAMICNLPGHEVEDDALNAKARAKREQLRTEGKVLSPPFEATVEGDDTEEAVSS